MDVRKSMMMGKKKLATQTSAPNYRHDGCSPLPLGMDASPPPQKWNGLHTVWPHDARTGWSYCVTIPSWILLPKMKNADDVFINPIVFYKVEVGIQSPEGLSTSRGILRRFSDFLKLFAALKRTFPRKSLPDAPSKHSFSRINSSPSLLQERRYELEDWIGNLLADLEVSRSTPIASFLELEAAARAAITSFSEVQQASSSTTSNLPIPSSNCQKAMSSLSGSWTGGASSVASGPLSFVCSDGIVTPRTESEKGSELELEPFVDDQESEGSAKVGSLQQRIGFKLDNEFKTAEDELPRGILEEGVVFSDKQAHLLGMEHSGAPGRIQLDALMLSPSSSLADTDVGVTGNAEHLKRRHQSKHSIESVNSESSLRDSESAASLVVMNKARTGQLQESIPHSISDFLNVVVVQMDQRERVKQVISALERRFSIAKADMQDLIMRLNQENATTDYLSTKVRDLEAELNTVQQKNRLEMQEALSLEHERVIDLQWEVEEKRTLLIKAEEDLNVEQEGRKKAEEQLHAAESTCECLKQQILQLTEKAETLEKDQAVVEAKARADIKVLAKELKNLRRNLPEIEEEMKLVIQAKAESEAEKKKHERWRESHAKFLHEIVVLHQRLKECSADVGEDTKTSNRVCGIDAAMESITTSDNRIGLLLAEAHLLAEEEETGRAELAENRDAELNLTSSGGVSQGRDKGRIASVEKEASNAATRKMLIDMLVDNALLRKAINSLSRGLLLNSQNGPVAPPEKSARKSMLNRFL